MSVHAFWLPAHVLGLTKWAASALRLRQLFLGRTSPYHPDVLVYRSRSGHRSTGWTSSSTLALTMSTWASTRWERGRAQAAASPQHVDVPESSRLHHNSCSLQPGFVTVVAAGLRCGGCEVPCGTVQDSEPCGC